MDVFISHSSKDKVTAVRLAQDLKKAKVRVWIDKSKLKAGDPLVERLQDAIQQSQNLILLWSRPASESFYVKAEWLAAYHLKKGIIPCLVDSTDLPPFLLDFIRCDFRTSYDQGRDLLVEALGRKAPTPPIKPGARPQGRGQNAKDEVSLELQQGQERVIDLLLTQGPQQAQEAQTKLDAAMNKALRRWASDPLILNLGGYHKKNRYMIQHWNAIQARMSPQDALLEEAEKLFFQSLAIQPDNGSALNGLGSILLLRRELDAAEFFVRRALAKSKEEGLAYPAAEQDLDTILQLKAERQKRV
jgi:tetratricopeptide (TPR) repeat protein